MNKQPEQPGFPSPPYSQTGTAAQPQMMSQVHMPPQQGQPQVVYYAVPAQSPVPVQQEHPVQYVQQPQGQVQYVQQQQVPVQYIQQQQTQGFQMATPIAALNMGPAPVDCPACGQRAMTTVMYEAGGTTHAWAALLCFCTGLGCIPYMMTGMKDVAHRCSKCGTLLATWHRSGRTQVHLSS